MKLKRVGHLILIFSLTLLFNNCGNGFKAINLNESPSIASTPTPTPTPTPVPPSSTPRPLPSPTTTDLEPLRNIVINLQPGMWHQLSAKLNDALLTRQEVDAIDPRLWMVTGSKSAINIWTSSAFDGRNWYFGVAGGHNAYNGNEMYVFNISTLSWKKLYDPSPCGEVATSNDCIPAWGPPAAHHYDGFVYSPKTDSLFLWQGGTTQCWEYRINIPDPKVAWQKIACPNEVGINGGGYYHTAILPNQNILVFGNGITNVSEFDPVTKVYSRYGGYWDGTIADISVADINTHNNKVYSLNINWTSSSYPAGVHEIDPMLTPISGNMMSDTTPPAGLNNQACFKYHPPTDKFVVWDGKREVYTFSSSTKAWSTLSNSVGPAPTSNHTNGVHEKCIYVPELDVFMFTNNENEGPWVYRLP